MRKYTILRLEIRKLDLNDIVLIAIFFALDIGRLCFNIFSQSVIHKFIYDVGFVFIMMFFMATSIAYCFSSFYFSLCWFLLSIIYSIEGGRALSYFCLLLYLVCHLTRYLFIRRYKIEFVPPESMKGRFYSVYNEREGRSSDERDNNYMQIIIWGAILLLPLCLWLSGKKV